MNKKIREIQLAMQQKKKALEDHMAVEGYDMEKAAAILDELDDLEKQLTIEERAEKAKKSGVPTTPDPAHEKKASGFSAILKMLGRKPMDETEKALISGENAASGENYLVPEDVRLEINELRKSYVSARELVTVESTTALTGSVNYEAGAPAGLTEFDDGDDITEETELKFVRKNWTIKWFGKLIPISRILQGAEQSGLMGYLNRWFVKNAVLSENAKIFATLKAGYNGGTPKAVAGWKALKKSITVDLDPSCLLDGVIATNQSGFSALDAEEDKDGKPVLQPNPANPTEKLFQGLPVKVYPDAQLENIDATHFPLIYGDTKAGATMVEYSGLEFTVSEHFLFGKNQNCMRVIEGFDTMSTDTDAYIYASFSATPSA